MKNKLIALMMAWVVFTQGIFFGNVKTVCADGLSATDETSKADETELSDVENPTGLLPLKVDFLTKDEFADVEVVNPGESNVPAESHRTYLRGSMYKASSIYQNSTQWSDYEKYKTWYYYNQLSNTDKAIWDALDNIYLGVLDGSVAVNADGDVEKMVSVGNMAGKSEDEIREIMSQIYLLYKYSNPQFYFISYGCTAFVDDATSEGYFSFCVYKDFARISSRNTATAMVKSRLEEMLSSVTGTTDEEKAKSIYDMIIHRLTYNNDGIQAGADEETEKTQTIYRALSDDKTTVCAGYSMLYTALCNASGIDAISVTSPVHAWNMHRINGAWVQVDATWGDDGAANYAFFERNDAFMNGKDGHTYESFYTSKHLLESCTYDTGDGYTLAALPSTSAQTPVVSSVVNGTTYTVTLNSGTENSYIYYALNNLPAVSMSKSARVLDSVAETGVEISVSTARDTTLYVFAVKPDAKDSAIVSVNLPGIEGATETTTIATTYTDPTVVQAAEPSSDSVTDTSPGTDTVSTADTTPGTDTVPAGDTTSTNTITKVNLAKVKLSVTNTSSGIKISYNKVSGAKGYKIQRKSGSSWKTVRSVGSGVKSYTDTSVKNKNGKTYQYRVVAVGGTNYNDSTSAVKKIYRLIALSFTSAKNIKTNSIQLNWKKNKKASGYQIKYVDGSKSKTVNIKSNKTLKKVIKKLKKNKTYKVYIRSYKKNSSGIYYSAWSSAKKIKIKK